MKKYLLSISLTVLAVILFLNFSAFKTEEPKNAKYILIEIYEIPKYDDNGVHIHMGNGRTDYIPFKPFLSEHHDDNGEIILSAINKLVAEGYEITHTAAGLAPAGMITKVFMKKEF
jgi:hypothetical protein